MLDIRTIITSCAITNLISASLMAVLWLQNRKRFAGIGFWLGHYLLICAAIVLLALRDVVPDFLSIVAGNGLIVFGIILLYMGLQRFVGKPGSQIHNYVLLAVFILVHAWFTYFQPSLLARNINSSLAIFIVSFQIAWFIFRKPDSDASFNMRGLGLVFIFCCLTNIARIAVDLLINPGNDFLTTNSASWAFLGYQTLQIALTLDLFLQVNHRLVVDLERDISQRKQVDQALAYRTSLLAALHQVTLDLVNRHEVDDILQTLLVNIGILLDASDISFDLVENNDMLVTYAVTSGQPLKKGDATRRGQGGWLSWQAIETGQPAVLEDYATWQKRRPLFDDYPIHAIMIIPIHQRDCVIGSINISRSQINKPFNDSDVYVAQQLAQMTALILDNAQLYSQLQSRLAESVQREQTLHQAQKQVIDQQRTLAAFDERQRLGRDLHDSVNQSIHSLMLFSETLVSTLEKNNIDRARQISERLQESARQALKETRLFLYQTQAPGREAGANLIEQLNARLAAVELRAGVRAQIILEGSLDDCPQEWRENLFWITIEALNNSLKHAQAQSVQIIIRCFPEYLELEVADDGKGFDTSKPGAGGYGLRNMRERAELLGGGLTFTSTLEQGAKILFRAKRAHDPIVPVGEPVKAREETWTK